MFKRVLLALAVIAGQFSSPIGAMPFYKPAARMIAVAQVLPDLNLDLRFSLDPRITFTRASKGWDLAPDGTWTEFASGAPRFGYDRVTHAPIGFLVEEQRTNLLLNSKIDGTVLSTQDVTTSAVQYALAFEGTGTITLTGTSTAGPLVGTGATDRVSLVFTPTAGTLHVTVSGSVKFAQLEATSTFYAGATSFIPTAGSTVTRSADAATMTGSNFSSWYNQAAGTFALAGTPPAGNANSIVLLANSGGNADRFEIYRSDVTGNVAGKRWGGLTSNSSAVTQSAMTSASDSSGLTKVAMAQQLNDVVLVSDGVIAGTDSSATVPAATKLAIGALLDSSLAWFNGHIARIVYYRRRLPTSLLIRLTAPGGPLGFNLDLPRSPANDDAERAAA